ncbi:MAG: OpcA/G6PD domain-containing protein, partial [Anaerolineales bacterium]
PIFEPLEPGLDRLILDSLSFAPPELYFQEVARVLSDPYFSPRVSDVSWARLASWRYLTAQTFDPPPVRAYLAQIERVQITYAEGSPVLAWLFGGWLASRLEWKLAAQDLRQALRFEGGPLIEFSPAPVGEAAPGDFLGVKLVARDGATFEVAQAPHACAAARVNLQDRKTERLVSFRSGSLADWLGHELSRLNRSPAYEAAVRLVAGA